MTEGNLLLVGGDSEIAVATAAHLRNRGGQIASTTRRPSMVRSDRPFLDLSLPLSEWDPPRGMRAACIFAAIARLQLCADDPAGSSFINVTQTLGLVDRLLNRGIRVLFLSTDKVFDGSRPHMPVEAPLCPLSEYGRQKAEAERGLIQRIRDGQPVTILRLSKIVSPHMKLLRQWSVDLSSGTPIKAFSDLVMAPTPVALVAAAIASLLAAPAPGIFQLSGPRDVSYAEVGRYIARKVGAAPDLVVPVSAYSAGMPTGSTPANTTLDASALRERFDIVVPDPWAVVDSLI
jgi:dTDP-4-dehydrorhamnose reductase